MVGAARLGLLDLVITLGPTDVSSFASKNRHIIAKNNDPTPTMNQSRREPTTGATRWTTVSSKCAKVFVVF